MGDAPAASTEVDVLRTTLRDELENLWGDLNGAMNRAANGQWSIECDHLASRIGTISHVVGPVDPGSVQMPLLLNGTFDRLHSEWGIRPLAWDRDATQALWDEYTQRATLRSV